MQASEGPLLSRWLRQVLPWLLLLSLAANLYLLRQTAERDRYANQFVWGNMASRLLYYFHHGAGNLAHKPERAAVWFEMAGETLESLQWLPDHQDRVDGTDLAVLRRFSGYAKQAAELAAREQAGQGMLVPETRLRLERLHAALELLVERLNQVNDLQKPEYAGDHAAWRAMWQAAAGSLSEIEFVPLPEST